MAVIGILTRRYNMQKKSYLEFWQEKAQEKGELLYIALGDSTATGIGASNPSQGYVWQIKEKFEEKNGKTVRAVNLGFPGATTEDLIKRQLPKLSEHKNPDLVTVSIGANDTNHDLPKEIIIKNLKNIISTIPDGSFIAEIPPLRGKDKNKTLEINTALKLFAAREKVIVVPLYLEWEKVMYDISINDYDFFHPNDKGYKVWVNTFWGTINR